MNATAQDIPVDQWPMYLNGLSRQYRGWRVTVEVLGHDLGDQRLAEGLPLQGLSFETKGSEAGDILIEAGDSPGEFMIHHVNRPRSVQIADTQPGEEADLRIESADGAVTLVRLRSPTALTANATAAAEP